MIDRERPNRKNKNYRKSMNSEIRKNRKDIMVEIMNISRGTCKYFNMNGRPYFDLEQGELEVLSLEELTEVNNRAKGFFKKYKIIVTDILTEGYEIDDVLNYLGLNRYYESIPNKDEDFLDFLIFEEDYDEFKNIFNGGTMELQGAIAGRLVSSYSDKEEREFIDREKIRLVGSKLGLRDIFEEMLIDDLD